MAKNDTGYYIGIDVGTGSARAGLFDVHGVMLGMGVEPITMWRPQPDFVQQSTTDIWRAVGVATRTAVKQAGIAPEKIKGIGIDATCSLALVDPSGRPVSVDPNGDTNQDVIVWMDHRATAQAEAINAGQHDVLRYVGGRVSPEMQTPKLLWLKQNMPDAWSKTAHFMDLPDYLTWRCTGDTTRSLCTTVCKWTYLGHEVNGEKQTGISGWDADYFRAIGLGDLADEGFVRIGERVRPMGEPIGKGLTAAAAAELGLTPGTAVGVSAIDAHAGGLGLLGGGTEGDGYNQKLALIGGTSTCLMAVADEPRFVPGVWGPYFSAMIPGLWLNEGGQSATGALIDRIVFGHAASPQIIEQAKRAGVTPYQLLNERLSALAGSGPMDTLTAGLHVDPDFHGNRSPHADPSLRGTISGLSLEQGADELALLYLATVQAIAYGTRHVIEKLNEAGYAIRTLVACGGGTKNPVFLQQHANATGCTIILPQEPEAVLLGSAILGSVAAGAYPSVPDAMTAMSGVAESVVPVTDLVDYHRRKYAVFHRLHDDQLVYRSLMNH